MIRRPLTSAQTLLLAFALVAQTTLASAAGQKTISIPSVPSLGAAAPAVSAALPSLPGVAPIATPSLSAPSIPAAAALPAAAIPAAAAPGIQPAAASSQPQGPAKGVSEITKAVAPQIQAIGDKGATTDGSVQSGEAIQTIMQGGKAAGASGVVAGMAEVSGNGGGSAAPSLAPAAPAAPKSGGNGPAAPQGPSVKPVDGRFSYGVRRLGLKIVAKLSGAVFSLPQAGPKLTAKILQSAKEKDAVLSDIDDTLGKYNTILEKETVDAIVGVRKAGKVFAAITDRPDMARKGSSQLGAFDTFSSVPVTEREGMIVATNGGGKIYQYDAQGEPKLIYEEPNLPESEKTVVKEAAEAVKAQLAGLGTGLQTTDPKDPSKPMEPENMGPYGMSLILKAGTPEATVKTIAHIFEAEMKARGLGYEVEGRMAKDPTLPPYVTFSKLNKSLAVKRIAALEKLEAGRTILIGDSMYAPKHADTQTALSKRAEAWGETLSGRPMPLTGNATDRNMELSLPGALTLSVGGTADPRVSNAFVLDGRNAEATRRVLNAVASTPKGFESSATKAGHAAIFLAIVVLAIGSWFVMWYGITGAFSAGPAVDPNMPPGMNGNFGIEDIFR
jgi:hydroxymethylpyrimidine pyrophosphatase-like HAD family hydrolase